MKFQFNYHQLVAEFVIVFVGVAVALAADQWRQGLQDRDLERSYLERLESDLSSGRERIVAYHKRFSSVLEAAGILIQHMESENNLADSNQIFELAAKAARSGYNRNTLTYSATFDELMATGNLSLIRNHHLRAEIISHFRWANAFVEEVGELPLDYNMRFKSITGYAPNKFTQGLVKPSTTIKKRLLQELASNEQILEEVRFFHAELGSGNIFGDAIDRIDALLALL